MRCGTALEETAAFCSACGFARTPAPTTGGTGGARRLSRADPVLNALRAITVGEYDIGGRLGVGGMASVYLAHDLRLNRRIAIKAMLPDLLDDEDMMHRFFDEARKQARLEHPNILPIYSLHWNEDVPFFAMKFVDGFSLDDVIHARGALPIPVVQHVLNGMIGALQYAHDEGVIHRDVKPGNVLIDRRGQTMVSDFGIAKAAESPHLTQTGAAIGTPTYMSPEQCRGLPLTPSSDQYAVGVVAFHMITGSPPFSGSMLDLLQAHAEDPPPSIAELCKECPPRLATAVMRMLQKSPDDRWADLRDALPDVTDGIGSETDARRELVALFPQKPTAAESLPMTPRSPMPVSSKSRKHSLPPVIPRVAPTGDEVTDIVPHVAPAGEEVTDIVPIEQSSASTVVLPPSAPPALPVRRKSSRFVAGASLVAVGAVAIYATRDRSAPTPAAPVVSKSEGAVAVAAPDTTAAVVTPAATPVAAPTAARVSLQLTRSDLRVGDSARATVRAFDSTGNRMTNVPITVESSAPKIVNLKSDGLMIAMATGTATITARSGDVVKSETVTVSQRLLPLSVAEASDSLKPVLSLVSDEHWDQLQNILKPEVLDAMRGKRGIDASLSGEPHVVASGIESATVDFDVMLKWRNLARLGRSGSAPLRATFVRVGQAWRITEIAARGKLP